MPPRHWAIWAEIIKIENPGGDRQRTRSAKHDDMGSVYMTLNRNKQSITLDMKDETAREKLRALIPTAQVFIHNVRVDAMARLGFGYDEVSEAQSLLSSMYIVWVMIRTVLMPGRQAFDDLVQAASGASDLLPRVDGNGEMRLLPSFVADKVSSLHAVYAVLAAPFHRERTGEGQFVEVPMFEAFKV